MSSRESFRNHLPEKRSFILAALLGALAGVPSIIGHDPDTSHRTPEVATPPPDEPSHSLHLERDGAGEQVILDFFTQLIKEKNLPIDSIKITAVRPHDLSFQQGLDLIKRNPQDFPGNAALQTEQIKSAFTVKVESSSIFIVLDRQNKIIGLAE